jgi:hypothetical protein
MTEMKYRSTTEMTQVTRQDLVQALDYALKIAQVGKLSVDLREAAIINKNLEQCGGLIAAYVEEQQANEAAKHVIANDVEIRDADDIVEGATSTEEAVAKILAIEEAAKDA